MRFCSLWVIAIGAVLATAAVAQAGTLGLDVTSDTQTFNVGVFRNVGWQFSVNSPITVDGLGIFDFDPAGLVESHQVGLWDDLGTLLAQTTVTTGSTMISSVSNVGDWLFQSIAPIVLVPGNYVTGAFYSGSASDSVMGFSTISLIPEISFLHSRASTEASFAEPGAYGLAEPGVFGANISVQTAPAAIPEPASLLLLGSGLVVGARRRRKRQPNS
jgi:hypothetical protein